LWNTTTIPRNDFLFEYNLNSLFLDGKILFSADITPDFIIKIHFQNVFIIVLLVKIMYYLFTHSLTPQSCPCHVVVFYFNCNHTTLAKWSHTSTALPFCCVPMVRDRILDWKQWELSQEIQLWGWAILTELHA